MTIFTRRRRLFSTACIVVILVAAAHTAGHLIRNPALEADPEFAKLLAAIDDYHAPLGMGMSPSFHAIHMTATAASLTGIYWVYQVPPPLVSLAVVTMLYAGSIRTTRA